MRAGVRVRRLAIACATAAVLAGCGSAPPRPAPGLERIQHIIVIYAENRSFDHLYGLFPGADGIANAGVERMRQVDRDGTPLPVLPPSWNKHAPDPIGTIRLPNGAFRLDAPPLNIGLGAELPSPVHRFFQHIEQIDGGRNDRFAAVSDAGGYTMGHFDGAPMRLWQWARDYVLADHFFMAAFGGSFLNHMWLVCACTPRDPAAPPRLVARTDPRGWLRRRARSAGSALVGPLALADGDVTEDGYAVNTMQPPYQPSGLPSARGGDPRYADPALHPLPPQTAPTIGDRLSARGISWAWYAGSWSAAVRDGMQAPAAARTVIYDESKGAPNFRPHHQPFNYFAHFGPGTAERDAHLRDFADLQQGIAAGELPAVAFYKPTGALDQHPGYTEVLQGDAHIADLLESIRRSKLWDSVAVIIAYDDNGGFWDHVPPPHGDRFGPGSRVPAIIVSPFAKRGTVDHTMYDTTSIIKFITRRFGLEPLPGVRAAAGDLTAAFDLAP